MKFSCFFTALVSAATVSAADNEAPVISLDLSYSNPNVGAWAAHSHAASLVNDPSRSFADVCEVSGNDDSATNGCTEPSASAFDHHDDSVSVDIKYHTILTSDFGVYLENEDGWATSQTVCDAGDPGCGLDFSKRAEYVIEYNAKDADDNDAETVTFALIVRDTEAPECTQSSSTAYCGTTPADLHQVSNDAPCDTDKDTCNITVELCNMFQTASWTAGHTETISADGLEFTSANANGWSDKYDGYLTGTASLATSTGTLITQTDENKIPTDQFAGLTSAHTLKYALDVNDYAGMFGSSGLNNNFQTTGIVTLNDSIDPVITNMDTPDDAECGYLIEHAISADYTDCYDDYTTDYNDVSITDGTNDWETVASLWAAGAMLTDMSGPDPTSNDPTTDIITIKFNVKDKFGNDATEESEVIDVVDNLAPTLYMTATEEAATNTHSEGTHVCVGADAFAAAEMASADNVDVKEQGCTIAEAKDGHSHYKITADSLLTHHSTSNDFDNALSEVTIQHSAGVDDGYTFFNQLMQEDTGFECIDGCWAVTTSVVQWVSGHCGGATGGAFDLKTVGTYYLHYSCKDGSGHETTACRTIQNVDKTRPIITVINQAHDFTSGEYLVEATHDNSYTDEGATCSDIVDDDVSGNIEVTGDTVDMATPGIYVINYNCKDSADNVAVEAYRTVKVQDTTCPTCTFPVDQRDTITVEASFPYTDGVVDCTDSLDSAIHGSFATTGAPTGTTYVDTVTNVDVEDVNDGVGYEITYTATDVAGNSYGNCYETALAIGETTGVSFMNTPLVRTVIVGDSIAPTIQVNYDSQDQITITETPMDVNTDLMGESSASVNGWVLGAVASAVSGVALLGYAATRKAAVATSVPV